MTTKRAEVFPPGEFIRDELEERGWTQETLAQILDRPLSVVNQIITGKKRITPDTARELAEAFGTSPELWLNLESAYRLSIADEPKQSVRERAALYDLAPVREMEKRGWINRTSGPNDLARELCSFFGTDSIDSIPPLPAAARQSQSTISLSPEQRAWCFRALKLATMVEAKSYSKARAVEQLPALRVLAAHPEQVQEVPAFLADIGIRLVVLEHLSRTKLDGAALWLDSKRPVIALSMRHGRIDYFWHTLGHELSHIINKDVPAPDADREDDPDCLRVRPEIEARADKDAAEMLIDPSQLESFIHRVGPLFYKERIIGFARRIKIHPGIIVGQLQHRGELKWSQHRSLLVQVRDLVQEVALTDGWGRTIPVD